ncbi:class I adenylate-forming enzyme family protein [Bradyrhizobium sp. STM 3566]|uniref:class I adenylate-forming enzyme family protein n=1 Tax=Bradyrhizobium sp. STM 3566 TaxID=578928 RepID=UPI00388FAFC7
MAIGKPPFSPEDLSTIVACEGGRTLSFAEWEEQAGRLAAGLSDQGIGAGDRVAVRMHNRLEWLVTNLALAKLRAVHVAINYRLTATEMKDIFNDCGVVALVCDDDDPASLREMCLALHLRATVCLGDTKRFGIAYSDLLASTKRVTEEARDFAQMIIYSSGTTGTPKGTLRTPPRDLRIAAEYANSVNFNGAAGGPGDRALVNLPLHHGVGPAFTRIALSTGGMVVFQRKFDPEQTLALIASKQITHWGSVPTMIRRVLNLPDAILRKYDVSSLKCLQFGGAPAGPELKLRATEVFGECLYESYGTVEAGMIAGATPLEQRKRPGTAGRAFKHVSIRIVDQDGRALPPGQNGEIRVHTPSIITGYIGKGKLGSDKIDADGYYRTGDVGYLDEEGYLFITDRLTDMIIAGGSNVYPAEIERALSLHPAVALAAVIGVPHMDLGEQPVAYVELKQGAAASESELIAFCEGQLAKYKWPRRIFMLPEIPVNTGGKLIKKDLRKLWMDHQQQDRTAIGAQRSH